MGPISTIIYSVIAAWIAPPLLFILYGFITSLFSDLPRISGKWNGAWDEPSERYPYTLQTSADVVRLKQVGRLVWGKSQRDDDDETVFKYIGYLRRDIFLGIYSQEKSNKPFGMGAFEFKILNNDNEMDGFCIWHDKDSKRIESSEYILERSK